MRDNDYYPAPLAYLGYEELIGLGEEAFQDSRLTPISE